MEKKYLSNEYSIEDFRNFFFIGQTKGINILEKDYKSINIRFDKSFENNLCHFHFIHENRVILNLYCDVEFKHPFTVIKYSHELIFFYY